jgi:membrane fusion protein, adhesin transport system
MLNISNKKINEFIDRSKVPSLVWAEKKKSGRVFIKIMAWFFAFVLIMLFIPWTQNIVGRGNVTTMQLDQRPQTIHSIIGGRIEKWYVREGDYVSKGDTILFISEIKDDYLDPDLLMRTEQQLKAKEMSVESYKEKINALDIQLEALNETAILKLQQTKNRFEQARLKVVADSIDFEAAKLNFSIAEMQFNRMLDLHKEGLKSLTDLENRKMAMQKAQAGMISQESRFLSSLNALINARVELTTVQAEYRNSIAKTESDRFSTLSGLFDAEAMVMKLKNQFTNYTVRAGMYYITAPQDGYVTKAIQSGIGETIKEGEQLLSIMPARYDLAVEMFVRPIDLPLIKINHRVRIQFDGWPAIVFSGWPNTSFGTFGGRIFAIDNFISPNGMYRVMVQPDHDEDEWPDALRVGAGTHNMLLLNDVPIWYELWRQINGFPYDYYTGTSHLDGTSDTKMKK